MIAKTRHNGLLKTMKMISVDGIYRHPCVILIDEHNIIIMNTKLCVYAKLRKSLPLSTKLLKKQNKIFFFVDKFAANYEIL